MHEESRVVAMTLNAVADLYSQEYWFFLNFNKYTRMSAHTHTHLFIYLLFTYETY
jgi:hypothetical protein